MGLKEKLQQMRMNIELAKVASEKIVSVGPDMELSCENNVDTDEVIITANITTRDFVEKGIYKKTIRTYAIPSKLNSDFNYTAEDVIALFGNYLVSVNEQFVDKNDNAVDYQPAEIVSFRSKK